MTEYNQPTHRLYDKRSDECNRDINKALIAIEVLTVGHLFYWTDDIDSDADLVTDLVELMIPPVLSVN